MRKNHQFKLPNTGFLVKPYTAILLFAILLFQAPSSYSQTGLITNISAATGNSYTVGELIAGTTIYSDRIYQATVIPSFLNSATFIKTPNGDKGNKSSSLPSFTLTQNATVYIAYDPRATTLPAWMNGWQKLTSQVGINDPNISALTLYSKTFTAGSVSLGGNLVSPAAGALNMYIIIALAQNQYNLTVNNNGNGTVTKNPDQATYAGGTSVTLTAASAAGQQFTGWSGDASGTTNPLTIIIDAGKIVTANFSPVSTQFNLTVTTSGNGTVTKNPDQTAYPGGTNVTLNAIPAAGQQFTGWSGAASGTVNPLIVTMDTDKAVTATFAPVSTQYTLTVINNGSGVVTKNPNQASYPGGASVSLSPTPAGGQQFTGWSGDASGTANPLTIIMNANKSITANFAPIASQFSVTVTLSGNGTVSKNPNQPTYSAGTSVALMATPAAGQQFTGWGGDATGNINPLTITVNSNKNITANFAQAPSALITNITTTTGRTYILATLVSGITVYTDRAYVSTEIPAFLTNAPLIKTANDDKGNKASSTLSFNLTQSATVYIAYDPRATALPGWLSSWQKLASKVNINDPNISGLTLFSKAFAIGKVTLGGNLASPAAGAQNNYFVMALAQSPQFNLLVTTTGNGTVVKNPNQASYAGGTGVTLTATPAAGQQFVGWSGDATGSANPLTVLMESEKSITAMFAPISTQYNLTVTVNGGGMVTKTPNQATYASGSSVSLTAIPAAGQQFSGWSGSATGTGNPLTIIMNSGKSISATFVPIQYNLITISNGDGTVTKDPDQPTYSSGSSVTLTATPANGQQFTGWSGDTTGATNPLTIIMNANKSVTAAFAPVTIGPAIATYPLRIYDNDVSGGAVGISRAITVKNTGQGVLSISAINVTGTNSNQFVLGGLPALPADISAGDSISFSIAFNPSSTGLKIAAVIVNSNDLLQPTAIVPLRALGTSGLGGSNEPSLQTIFNLLEIQAIAGDDNIATGIIHSNTTTQKAPLLGDEVSIQQFQKAGAGDVTITPLDVFGPTFNSTILALGWYKSGDTASRSELFTVSNTPVSNGQTVNVNYNGTLTFDPASDTFGFYSRWPFFKNRHLYSEDSLNTFAGAAPHHVRVFLYKKNGIIIPNSYVVAFEEDTAKLDYQDLVFVVSNVKKYTVPSEVTIFPLADAYVRNGTFSNTNFGSDTLLEVRSSASAGAARFSYIKFSLNAVSGVAKIKSARVRLYGYNKDNSLLVNATLFGVNNDSWTETGINLNNAPAPILSPLSTTIITQVADYYDFDVTDFLKAELTGDNVVSFFVKDTTNKNTTLVFNSKENNQNAPQLIIDTSTTVSNASMFVENMDGYPSNEHVVFARMQIPWTRDTIYNANHDSVKIRIRNYGINPLMITKLKISVDSLWKIDKLNGIDFNPLTQLPAVVSSGGILDLMVKFTADKVGNSNTRIKILRETLTIISNDDKNPAKKVYLDGLWQYSGEGAHEPYTNEIFQTFGYTSKTGFVFSDPDVGDTTTLKGDEIKPEYFLRADSLKPVTVRQLNAHHGCCHQQEYFKWFAKGSPTVLNTVFNHIAVDAQTLLPRRSLSGAPAGGTFIPPGAFAVLISTGNSTVPSLNTGKKMGVRVYKAFDASGNIIPDTYLLGGDYLGTPVTNYDYNDNIYYITNVKPHTGTVHHSAMGVTPSDLDYGERVLETTDSLLVTILNEGKTYSDGSQDPPLVISSVKIVGENATEFTAEMPLSTSVNPQESTTIKVKFNPLSEGLKIADLLIYYNNTRGPKRVPLYGIAKQAGVTVTAHYRINSGASSATTFEGKTWAADNQFAFDNLEPYKNPAVKLIAATDEDFLYVDEQSSNGDKRPFRYQLPVPNGNYYVRLHFAEIYWGTPGLGLAGGAGSRVFSVKLENQYRLANYDLIQDAGVAVAVIKNFPVTVTDGNLNIDFSATVNRPLVSAVEVYSFSSSTPGAAGIEIAQNQPAVTGYRQPGITSYDFGRPQVYPNPLRNKNFNIRFPANYQGMYSIQLADILGRVYNLGKTKLNGANSSLKVDIARFSLKPGVYFLKISSNTNKADVIKLLIN